MFSLFSFKPTSRVVTRTDSTHLAVCASVVYVWTVSGIESGLSHLAHNVSGNTPGDAIAGINCSLLYLEYGEGCFPIMYWR